jgi:hypothetical protein
MASGYLTRMLARRVRTDGFVDPCIPTIAATGPGRVHGIKHDGYRLILRRDDENCAPQSNDALKGTLDDQNPSCRCCCTVADQIIDRAVLLRSSETGRGNLRICRGETARHGHP